MPVETLGSIAFFFMLAVLAFNYAGRHNYFVLPEKTTSQALINLWDTSQLFALFIACQFFLLPLILSFFNSKAEISKELAGWLNLIAICIVTDILSIFFCVKWKKMKPLFMSGQPAFDIGIGIATWLIAFPTAMFFSQILTSILSDLLGFTLVDQTAVLNVKESMNYPLLFAFSILAVAFVVPVLEEILFRGYLQTALSARLGPLLAIAISSAIFSSFHYAVGQGINNVNIVGTLFVLSLFLGYIRERQGNLLPSIALHSTFNSLSILMLFLQ